MDSKTYLEDIKHDVMEKITTFLAYLFLFLDRNKKKGGVLFTKKPFTKNIIYTVIKKMEENNKNLQSDMENINYLLNSVKKDIDIKIHNMNVWNERYKNSIPNEQDIINMIDILNSTRKSANDNLKILIKLCNKIEQQLLRSITIKRSSDTKILEKLQKIIESILELKKECKRQLKIYKNIYSTYTNIVETFNEKIDLVTKLNNFIKKPLEDILSKDQLLWINILSKFLIPSVLLFRSFSKLYNNKCDDSQKNKYSSYVTEITNIRNKYRTFTKLNTEQTKIKIRIISKYLNVLKDCDIIKYNTYNKQFINKYNKIKEMDDYEIAKAVRKIGSKVALRGIF